MRIGDSGTLWMAARQAPDKSHRLKATGHSMLTEYWFGSMVSQFAITEAVRLPSRRGQLREKKVSLTDEQIENWRKVLVGMLGPYALLMSKQEIQAYRDKMQSNLNSEEEYGN